MKQVKQEKRISTATLYRELWRSPIGPITVVCSDKGLREVAFSPALRGNRPGHSNGQEIPVGSRKGRGARLAGQVHRQLEEYLAGSRRRFTVPLDLQGTPFQLKVWAALLQIPYGRTRSYGEIAREVGKPRAARAVGMANHWNPVAIIVPCHRVIASDGSLGGYAGGLGMKSRLLSLEADSRKRN